jgi:hypothetical protein
MTGQLKALCIKALQDEVKAFQEVRWFSHSALEPI